LNEYGDGELGPPLDPRNLMADLIEFASVVMQGIKDSKFSSHLRHRKSAVGLLDRSSSNTMAAVLLGTFPRFPILITAMLSEAVQPDIFLFDLMKFVIKREGPVICEETFTTLLKIVGIFNFFIIYGDCFLLGPSTYDDLYYELIRRKDAIEQLIKFAHIQYHIISGFFSADQYSTSEGGWKSLPMDLRDSIKNLEAIVRHYNMKISAFISNGSVASLTEDEAMKIIQDNYSSLNLRVYDELHKYYEPITRFVEDSDERMLAGIVQGFRRNCLESSIAYQSRFDELAVIH
uniref:DUF1741 domain-containing protein n=1 Tax=Rodentolepis nana TaxID=102285 RepID=A0A0R3T6B3_RODNA